MNKGLTLIEVLAVITLLGFLYLLLFPATLNFLRQTDMVIDEATKEVVITQTKEYLNDYPNLYPKVTGSVYCIEMGILVEEGYLGDYLFVTDGLSYNQSVKVMVNNQINYQIVLTNECVANILQINFVDQSGANPPVLHGALIPVLYNEGWVTADPTEEWYNYNEKHWANAVLVKADYRQSYLDAGANVAVLSEDVLAHFVWIPRFRYKVFNYNAEAISDRLIEIEFEGADVAKSIATNNNQWQTHPAFSQDDELKGFWVGKFTTTGNEVVPTIRPNQVFLTNQTLKEQYETAKLIGEHNYGLQTDSKIMRNIEWGAVSYLTHSRYGIAAEIWTNPNQSLLSGCSYQSVNEPATSECSQYNTIDGLNASSTGNIYGVYDMSGGVWQRVLGVMVDESDQILTLASGFGSEINNIINKIDLYEYNIASDTYQRRILGDATGEVFNWYDDTALMPYGANNAWLLRGGQYDLEANAGLFAFGADDGAANLSGFRIVVLSY